MTQETVLITGANRGIGLALTEAYLNDKAKVIATCRTPHEAKELHALQKKHPDLTVEALDVTESTSRKALAEKQEKAPIDILINNAGILTGDKKHMNATMTDPTQELGTYNEEAWMKVLRTNSIAPIMLTQDLFGNLENGTFKKIIMITSEMASISNMSCAGDIAYSTSKTILNAATKSIALHLQPKGYIVAALHPGWVQTDMGSKQAPVTTQESAKKLIHLISKLTDKQTGSYMDSDGKVMAW